MNGPALLALQHIDSALEHVEHRRKRLPELAAHTAATAALTAIERTIAGLEARIVAAEASIEHAEQESAQLTAKRTRLEAQLKTVIAPREAEALMHEIEILTARRSELDDAELAALDDAAGAEDERRAALAERDAQASLVDDTASALASANAGLDAERDELSIARPSAMHDLTHDELATYERMRTQYHGVAVAQLVGATCQGCHLDLSRGELDVLRALPEGEPGECPQCNRLLVR